MANMRINPVDIISKAVLESDKKLTFIAKGIFSVRKEEESATTTWFT